MKNREIKFRAWSNKTNKMMEWDFIKSVGNLTKLITLNHVEVMQFTGLVDKAKKEIYEGDILSTNTDKSMVVSYDKKYSSFCLTREGWAFKHFFGEAANPEDCKVIGNIFQDPGLLK